MGVLLYSGQPACSCVPEVPRCASEMKHPWEQGVQVFLFLSFFPFLMINVCPSADLDFARLVSEYLH